MTPLPQLCSTRAPRVHLVVLASGQTPRSALAVPPGFLVRAIDGRRGETKVGLLTEFARALEFPSDSGRNWDALEELLTDLEWLPAKGYLLIVSHADQLLTRDPEDYDVFIDILKGVAAEWATPRSGEPKRPAVPFHVCLVAARGRERARSDWRVPRLSIERKTR